MSDLQSDADLDDAIIAALKQETADDDTDVPAFEWAIVEIFGHRRHAGRIREEERFGAKMLRVDVPSFDAGGAITWTTHWYGGSSIFSLTLSDEATVKRFNRTYAPPARLIAPRDDGQDVDEIPDDDPDYAYAAR